MSVMAKTGSSQKSVLWSQTLNLRLWRASEMFFSLFLMPQCNNNSAEFLFTNNWPCKCHWALTSRQTNSLLSRLSLSPCKSLPAEKLASLWLRRHGFKLKRGEIYIRQKKEILYSEGDEALAQVAQRSCGCPLPGRVQGQVGRGSEQPGLVEGGWN